MMQLERKEGSVDLFVDEDEDRCRESRHDQST